MLNLNGDLAVLTTIPVRQLDKLTAKGTLCLANAVAESVFEGKDEVQLDIGYGQLNIKKVDGGIKYIFIPSCDLEEAVKDAFTGRHNSLTETVESVLVDRIVNTYKDLI